MAKSQPHRQATSLNALSNPLATPLHAAPLCRAVAAGAGDFAFATKAKAPAPAATALQRGRRCEHCFRHAPHTHLFPQIGPAQAPILHDSFLVHRSWKEICAEAHEAEAAGAEVPVTE